MGWVMQDRKRIEEKLRRKEQEIEALEERLKTTRVYVQALQDVLKLFDKDTDASAASVLRAGSAVAQAREIILARGAPVHITTILEAMGKNANRNARASLTSSLAAYVRRGEVFTRPAPNTFGLEELGHSTETERDEPPAGFGQVLPLGPSRPEVSAPPAIPPKPTTAPTAPQRGAPSPPLAPKAAPAPIQSNSDLDDDIPF
jgi:hypothetical protein